MRTHPNLSFPCSSLGTRIPEDPLRAAGSRASGTSVPRREPGNEATVTRGFTLLELLIAIGLTSILMIALFSAMQIYFNLQLDGHEEITRQQIARTLLRQMTRDIQSTVFVKKDTTDEDDSSPSGSSGSTGTSNSTGTSGSTGSTSGSSTTTGGSPTGTTDGGTSSGTGSGTGSSTSTSTTGNTAAVDSTSAVMTTYTNGIVGTADDLLLYVSRPEKNLSYVTAQSLTSTKDRTSDLMIVRYLIADTSAGGISSDIADRFAGSDNGAIGLVRITGDLYGMSTAVEDGEETGQNLVDKIDAKEVSKLQFRYFDGINWQEKWDSTSLNQLPTAIEIVLTLRNTQTSGTAFEDDEADQYALGETTHRMIVAVPIAEPFIAETAL